MGQQDKEWMIGNTTLAENEGEKKNQKGHKARISCNKGRNNDGMER